MVFVELFEQRGYGGAEGFELVHELDVVRELVHVEGRQEVFGEALGAAEGHVDKSGGARTGGPDAPLFSGREGDQEGQFGLDFLDHLLDFVA